MLRRGYILVTPAKDEEKNLPLVANSVINQTIKPNLWVIIDDGSTDGTPNIIKKLTTDYPWIVSIRLPQHPRDITFHYAYVCRKGFKYAIKYAREHHIPFEYIGLLDADTVIERKYFEKLMNEFKNDSTLGIASGVIYVKKEEKWVKELNLTGYPRGTGRLWRKRCFFDSGGYRVLPSPDSVSNRMAIRIGWKVSQFDHIKAYQLRPTSSAEGLTKGYIKNGEMAYYLGKSLVSVLLGSVFYSIFGQSPLSGLMYIYGYLKGFIKHDIESVNTPLDNKKIRELFSVDPLLKKPPI